MVSDLLRRLEEHGWQYKPDLGWCEYDVEVYGTRWADVQVMSAVEHLSREHHVVRFRLRPAWSIQAKTALGVLCATNFVLIGFAAEKYYWILLLLLTLPLFAWFVRRKTRSLQSLIRVFLDTFAEERGLEKLVEGRETRESKPTVPPVRSVFSAPEPGAGPADISRPQA